MIFRLPSLNEISQSNLEPGVWGEASTCGVIHPDANVILIYLIKAIIIKTLERYENN